MAVYQTQIVPKQFLEVSKPLLALRTSYWT